MAPVAVGDVVSPLFVLDLSENDARHLVSYLEITVEEHPEQLGFVGRDVYTNVADQIEAQTKPARIEEPKDIGSGVRASSSQHREVIRWTKYNLAEVNNWIAINGIRRSWDQLIDPVLIREGLS